MTALDDIISINISSTAAPVSTVSTTLPLLIAADAPSWTDSLVMHTYSSVADMVADGFASDSDTVTYATKLLGQANQPAQFLVGKKAGSALTAADLDGFAAQNNSFYGIIPAKASDDEILLAAEWTQAQRKMLFAATKDVANADATNTSSLAANLKAQSLSRTALLLSPTSGDKGIEAAWVGGQLPLTPGSNNWAYQTLAGVSTDTFTAAQRVACLGVPVAKASGNGTNLYENIANRGVTQMGTTGGGLYIDNVIGEDWLYFNLQSAVFAVLANTAKVPYTDRGVALLISAVRTVLDTGVANGLIDPAGTLSDGSMGIKVSAARVATVPQSDKIARRAPTINFECVLQGAVNSVAVVGVVSV